MRVILDTLAGGRAELERNQAEFVRRATVLGVTGAPAERLARALRAPGIPSIGAAYPGRPDCRLERIQARALEADNESFELDLVYRTPNLDNAGTTSGGIRVLDVELIGSTFQERRNTDAAGRLMLNTFRGPVWLTDGAFWGLTNLAEQVEVDIYRPQLGCRIQHVRPALPAALAAELVGTVNAEPWSGYPPRTWLCTGLPADSRSGEVVATFEALYRAETWTYQHAIKFNGQVPEAAVLGNGLARFDVYPAVRWLARGLGVELPR